MDFSVIIQRLNELTTFMNNVRTLSKKIFQLPPSTEGVKWVAVYNDTSEETEKLNLTEALDGMYSLTNGITAIGNITRDGADFTFEVGFEWLINGISYANAEITRTINDAGTGNHRIDIAVCDTNNDIYIIEGFEVPLATAVVQPPTPPNTLFICSFLITESVIGDNTSPELFGQNNIPLKIEIESTDLATNDVAGFVDYINALNPALNVLETNSLVQYYLTDTKDVYQFVGIGKGVYGLDNLQITSANVFKFSVAAGVPYDLEQVLLQGGRGVVVHDGLTDYEFTNADRSNIVVARSETSYNLTTSILDPFTIGDKLILVNATQTSSINFYVDVDLVQNILTSPILIPIGYTAFLTYLYDFEDVIPTWSLELIPFQVNSGETTILKIDDAAETYTTGLSDKGKLIWIPTTATVFSELTIGDVYSVGDTILIYSDGGAQTISLAGTSFFLPDTTPTFTIGAGELVTITLVDNTTDNVYTYNRMPYEISIPTGGGYTVVNANQTASNDTNYTVVANATFTDPSPTEGKGYVVYVMNGTATIGGTGYVVGSLVFRVYHSGAWSTKVYKDETLIGSAIQTELNKKDVLPVIYEKHANVPIFGSASLNNLEGVGFTVAGGTARTFNDGNTYTRRQRLGLTVAVTGNLGQARQTITYYNRNSSLHVIVGVGFAENCTNANVRAFAGITSNTGVFSNVEPTALINCFGIAKLTTSNNLHLVHNDGSGTATAVDLGASFPTNTIETDFYLLEVKTNGSNLDYVVTRVNTGDTASGSISTDIPATTQALNLGYYVVQSTGANTTTGIDYFGTNLIKS